MTTSSDLRSSRRQFLGGAATVAAAGLLTPAWGQGAKRPNILWISCEDISPDLGCYGDAYATSPSIDNLAAEGRSLHALLLGFGRLRAEPLGDHHRHVPDHHRHHAHAVSIRTAAGGQVLPGISPCRRILLHEQLEDRLPVRAAVHRMGRIEPASPLAEPRERSTVLRRLQPHRFSRKLDPHARKTS